jgi:large subunit ribosomal protein L22
LEEDGTLRGFEMAIVRATHKHARVSARKVRPFADLIRGLTVQQARETLKYVPNRGARFVEAVLNSAAANAEDRGARNIEGLHVAECRVDGGPMFKRIRPRARGMVFVLRKRFAHIYVGVDAPEVEEKK